ncbi:ImcF-related family protein [Paraburkholderia sp.]|uniref:ImcF-related family protein n=1 Tax=Paraburkholderia sp. TaxID=1926495 RepID=UPI003D6DF5FC
MNEPRSEPAALFIGIAIGILFVALGAAAWTEGSSRGWSFDTRIIIELCLLSGMLLALMFVKYFEAVLLWVASMRATRWLMHYDSQKQVSDPSEGPAFAQGVVPGKAVELREVLRERHGWRWRYRDRWIVLAGDEPLVKRLAPRLVETGYVITGDAVLLYARQIGGRLDTAWLDQIRRMRRRRPADAIVTVVRTLTAGAQVFDTDRASQRLTQHARALRWAAPAYVLNVTESGRVTSIPDDVVGCTWSNARPRANDVDALLGGLSGELADAGVMRLMKDATDHYLAELSQHMAQYGHALANLVTQIDRSRVWRNAIQGVFFRPLFNEYGATLPATGAGAESGEEDAAIAPQQTVWHAVAGHCRHIHGRRVGFSPSAMAAWVTTMLVGLWIVGTMLSGLANRETIRASTDTIAKLSTEQDRTQAALTLYGLQKQLDTTEIRQRDGAPWYRRFGLNRDAELFAALWPAYERGAGRIVAGPVRVKLEEHLRQFASLSDAEIASGGDAQVNLIYDTLKSYLMLARPERADAAFLTQQLIATSAPARPADSSLTDGAWRDLRAHLIAFYADHLRQRLSTGGTSLAIIPDASLVNAARQTVIGVRGIQNSTNTLYQQILDEAKPKYPPLSLATVLGEAAQQSLSGSTSSRGLFNTAATLPGVFTRTAWDERISNAIDDASEQRSVVGDWVLSDNRTDAKPTASLKAELRQRYFDDYARAWQQFLNSIRWQPTPTLSGTVDQLILLADPQRSPLVALMNVVVYQAGAGVATQSLSDTLITKAQQLVGNDNSNGAKNLAKRLPPQDTAPLAPAFGPLLRLTGSDIAAGDGTVRGSSKTAVPMAATGDLSLARFLERVTAMRLKLQQISLGNDPDALSRAAAQAVLQGKTSGIADSRDYASRVAASLGEQWAGLGALFEAPLDQTWQVVLQPAASSLNDTWRTAIVADWAKTFGGRYPFADSDNDASLPEMARFMRPDNGVIAQFVTSQLAGIVERQGDRWVLAEGGGQHATGGALTVDPAFLAALNRLTHASTVLFPSGDAHVRYELRAVPTPGVTDMRFLLSGRELHYFNQKEEWTPFIWPGDTLENITHVEWQTAQGGLRSALDTQGRFGLVRLLERATVMSQDSARYLLTWMPDQSQGIPLRVQLRSEAGAGPLDVLTLRHFILPSRIFVTASAKASWKHTSSGPPPLPPAAIAAAKHAATPLPQGALPEVE